MESYRKIFTVAVLLSLIAANLSYWIFVGDWRFLPVPLSAGVLFVVAQRQNMVYKFLAKLAAGSLAFGFLAALSAHAQMYFIANLFYDGGLPFWPFYNPKEYLIFSLVFSFLSFMGGLAGIVVKGFYVLYKKLD